MRYTRVTSISYKTKQSRRRYAAFMPALNTWRRGQFRLWTGLGRLASKGLPVVSVDGVSPETKYSQVFCARTLMKV